jgi:hypothetical protein
MPSVVCVAPPEDEKIMLETFRGPQFFINSIKLHHVGCTTLIINVYHIPTFAQVSSVNLY